MGTGATRARLFASLALTLLLTMAGLEQARASQPLERAEEAFADWLDAGYALSTVQAGPITRLDGRGAPYWARRKLRLEIRLTQDLGLVRTHGLGPEDSAALARMKSALAEPETAPTASTAEDSARLCDTVSDQNLDASALSKALYACFEHLGDHIAFDGGVMARATALEQLQAIEDGERRRALFAAFAPLWNKVNGADQADSPYRRLIRMSAAQAKARGRSAITEAAATLGETPGQAEAQLVAVLEAWRVANPGPPIDPWDYWNHYASGVAPLDALIPPDRIQPLCDRYYRDLGADLQGLGLINDLGVRPGKAPVAYTEFIRIGRRVHGGWRPARVRVSANVERGGLLALNEIVHEDGHAVHMMAVRARPAEFDLGDDLFVEAFADVTSWSVAEPAWQKRYLGQSLEPQVSLRALYANVMMDVAWGLFELRLLRDPEADPNAVWTEITSRYLNIRPHPGLAWWAMRVQLVDTPGYMINYGLGAILTADLRHRFRRAVGDFSGGDRYWYPYASEHLLRFGAMIPTRALLQRFLGRPVSIEPLLTQIGRISAPMSASASESKP